MVFILCLLHGTTHEPEAAFQSRTLKVKNPEKINCHSRVNLPRSAFPPTLKYLCNSISQSNAYHTQVLGKLCQYNFIAK